MKLTTISVLIDLIGWALFIWWVGLSWPVFAFAVTWRFGGFVYGFTRGADWMRRGRL